MKRRVLFLCTGNSCRSQMAEAMVNSRLHDRWEAVSAGTQPAEQVHPKAVAVLSEMGIDWRGHSPKHADAFRDVTFDLVVTLCDGAAESCPFWPGQGRRVHLGFPDPAQATGSEEEVLGAFRNVRDAIAEQVLPLLRARRSPRRG